MPRLGFIVALIAALVIAVLSSIFVVDEREQALVLQFGQIKQVKKEPGLGFKLPIIQEVKKYDDRILSLDTETVEVTPSDDRRLMVDAFARYRIDDVVAFRQAVGAGGIFEAENQLDGILNSRIRAVLGADGVTSSTILSPERASLMERITAQTQARAKALGLEVVDVRLKQTNLPDENLDATFARMRAEREREAADERARGEEAAQRVRALADRTVTELTSEAQREAEIVRGQADAERNAIFAEAFGADPEFFEFYRSMNAYRAAFANNNSQLVISPDSEFFSYFGSDTAGAESVTPAVTPEALEAAQQAQAAAEAASEGAVPASTQDDSFKTKAAETEAKIQKIIEESGAPVAEEAAPAN